MLEVAEFKIETNGAMHKWLYSSNFIKLSKGPIITYIICYDEF